VTAVELRDVFRVFTTPEGDAAALQGVSLSVERAETVAILGPSGSGKTTLLRILAGLDRPSAGAVRVLGFDLAKLSQRRLTAYRRTTLAYADQRYSRTLTSELSARELVAVPLGLRGEPRRERLARANALLERVGLLDRGDARPHELSGGEQQRVAICAALAPRPRLFLADEPTGELDRANARIVFELIGALAREAGCTTLLVSHDPEAATVADRVVRMRDGRIAGEAERGADDETIVVGRGGWVRLPEEYLARTGIRERARARVEGSTVLLSAVGASEHETPRSTPQEDARYAAGVVASLTGVRKAFGPRVVLDDRDASFAAGRFYAVTGPSGSGKTTLLQLLAGLALPDEGSVSVLGEETSRLDRAGRAELRARLIGFVGQQPGLVGFLSAEENVALALAIRGKPTGGARELLDAVGLAERRSQRVARLSSGEAERVAIARALAARPALLLADEPSSRLDEANAVAIANLLRRLAHETGAAVVCATHDPLVLEQADEELSLGVYEGRLASVT
jgi:ABC-type lipoprotein export system ATPase subunit